MFGSFFDFSHAGKPFFVRANYRHELLSSLTYPLASAMAEGSFAAVVAKKYFQASPLLIAVIVAAPMFGNILALLWADLSERREKVPLVNALQVGVIGCTAAVGATYFLDKSVGGWAFAFLMVAARLLASGIVTVRNVVWRANFPRHLRGQLVSKITFISSAMLAITTFFGSWLLDYAPASYALLYVACSLLGLIGVRQFARVRTRGDRTARARVGPREPIHPVGRIIELLRTSRQLLREDRHFRVYQRAQMLQGMAFMAMLPPMYEMVSSEMTDPQGQYNLATTVIHVVPALLTTLFIQAWAPLFDRMNIVRFRFMQSCSALLTHVLLMSGALTDSLPLMTVGMIAYGISMAGGNLAWNLGQNAFASAERLPTYVGVHVMLTGLRGMFAPFIGTLLYSGFHVGGYAWSGIHRWTFVVTTLLCLTGTSLFGLMLLDETARDRNAEGDGEALDA